MQIKRKAALLLAAVLTASSVFSGLPAAAADSADESAGSDPRGSLMAGEFISVSSVTPSGASVVVNDNGMSGLESYIHLHDTKAANSYKTKIAGKKGAFTFAFSEIVPLGYMYIWNYNANGALDDGMKDVKIQYSLDKENWFDLGGGDYTLARALESENVRYGGNSANNQNDGYRTPINFGGLSVKYVRIIPQSNYGGDGYGLSEVRFFRFKTRPKSGSLISASGRAPKSTSAVNLSNNYGLSDLTSYSAVHSNAPETMWYSEQSADDSFVVLDLDGTYPIRSLYIWNYNDPDNLNSGVKRVRLEYTTKNPYSISGSTINYAGGEWTTLGEYEIPIGTGTDGMPYSLSVEFEEKQAQYIRITPLENYGGDGFGLSAVRAFAGSGWAVEPSRDWSQLFSNEGTFDYQTSGVNKSSVTGWLAADGIYTVNMNGSDRAGSSDSETKTTFLFSDTLVGNFSGFGGTAGQYGKNMYYQGLKNNTLATLIGNTPDPRNMQFYLTTSDSSTSILGDGNWAQELVKIGDRLFCWSFSHIGLSAANFMFNRFDLSGKTLPDFATKPSTSNADILTEYNENGTDYRIEFSGAVMDNTESGGATPDPDGYIYLYGIKSYQAFLLMKSPVVARVKPEDFSDVSAWRYWNGSEWVDDVTQCAVIDGGDGMVSNEFSVSYMESGAFAGKYVMNFTNFTITTSLALATADTPYGTFNNSTDKLYIYDCPQTYKILEKNGDSGIYTYNSKAHPHLSKNGELLISYNVNSYNFDDRTSFEYLHPYFVTLFTIDESASSDSPQRAVTSDGEELAAGAAVTVSVAKQGSSAENAVDSDVSTAWESGVELTSDSSHAVKEETALTLDFGTPKTVNKVVLHWGSQAKKSPDGYKIEYSSDGENWYEADAAYHYGASRANGSVNYSADTVRFDAVSARYLRVNVLKASGLNSPSIREIEVYNSQTVYAPSEAIFTPSPLNVGAHGETDSDYSALESALAKISSASPEESKYTAESWSKFIEALNSANALMASSEEAQQSKIEAAVSALNLAYAALVVKPSASAAPNNTPNTSNTVSTPTTAAAIKNGWVKKGGKTYYYKNGVLKKNAWVKVNGKTYRTNASGAKITGTKWITVKGKKYRLVKSVRQSNKIIKIGKKRYYVAKTGVLKKNVWIKYKKKWYRANKKGVLLQNTVKKIKGKKYRFNKKAVCKNKK